MFLDSHCHLVDSAFDQDRDEVIGRALAAGLRYLLTIATEPAELEMSLGLAERYEQIYVAAGMHPHEAARCDETALASFRAAYAHPRVIAVGEIGLDFYYDNSPREQQEAVFRLFLREALRTGKPVVIHLRDPRDGSPEATQRFRTILDEEDPDHNLRGVMHCFSGSYPFAVEMIERSFLISFPGILTFKKADELRETARRLPMDAVLVETDSPYLAPVPHRGKRNEPVFVIETARVLAAVRGISHEVLDVVLTRNFERLFGITETR